MQVIPNRYLRYTRKKADSSCTSNDELHYRSNVVSAEQRILALLKNWSQKASDKLLLNNTTKKPLNIIKSKNFL